MICSPRLAENLTGFLNISSRVRLDLQTRQLPFGRRVREFIGQVARFSMYFSKMLLSLNFSLFMATRTWLLEVDLPAGTWRNDNVIITSKRRSRGDVVLT